MSVTTRDEYVLTLSCPDQPGIVNAVTSFLLKQECTIVESQQFDDFSSTSFFMRVRFAHVGGSPRTLAQLEDDFSETGASWRMEWRMVSCRQRPRVLIMVSKFPHCLNDLLFRHSMGELNIDIVAVVSNHPDLEPLAATYGVPYHHIPNTRENKSVAEEALLNLVNEQSVDLVVLARYMQVLSDELCKQLEGRAINIHHSMLPSFKGAKPYHQAFLRGVKFVGATAHYVTADLDEGPIIEQEVTRVDHSMDPDDLIVAGRETERRALARAVRWHCENRILVNGQKTVVLR